MRRPLFDVTVDVVLGLCALVSLGYALLWAVILVVSRPSGVAGVLLTAGRVATLAASVAVVVDRRWWRAGAAAGVACSALVVVALAVTLPDAMSSGASDLHGAEGGFRWRWDVLRYWTMTVAPDFASSAVLAACSALVGRRAGAGAAERGEARPGPSADARGEGRDASVREAARGSAANRALGVVAVILTAWAVVMVAFGLAAVLLINVPRLL